MKADSQIAGTVAQSPINIGKKAVDIALNVLDGKDFEAETAIDVFMINKDNVEMYGADGWQQAQTGNGKDITEMREVQGYPLQAWRNQSDQMQYDSV